MSQPKRWIRPILTSLACASLFLAGEIVANENLFQAISAYWGADYDVAEELLTGIDRTTLSKGESLILDKFLGASRLAKGDSEGARRAFVSLLLIDPTYEISADRFSPSVVRAFEDAHRTLARQRYEEGMQSYNSREYEAAIGRFEQALKLDPRHPMAGELIGLARERAGSSEDFAAGQGQMPTGEGADSSEPVGAIEIPVLLDLQPAGYQIATLKAAQRIYVDRDYVLADIPVKYQGLTMIRTANDHKVLAGHAVSFELNVAATVFIAYDRRLAKPPGWLHMFRKTGPALKVIELGHEDKVTLFDLYFRDFPAGPVMLGANVARTKKSKGKSMYFAFVKPADS